MKCFDIDIASIIFNADGFEDIPIYGQQSIGIYCVRWDTKIQLASELMDQYETRFKR